MEATRADSPAKAVGCQTMKLACLAEAGAAEILGPVEAGSFGGEVGLLPGVVGLVDVVVLSQAEVLFRDGVFQFDDALRRGRRCR